MFQINVPEMLAYKITLGKEKKWKLISISLMNL